MRPRAALRMLGDRFAVGPGAEALEAAREQRVGGQAVTPFVLEYLHRESGGATAQVNRRLIADNAALAGEVAAAAAPR